MTEVANIIDQIDGPWWQVIGESGGPARGDVVRDVEWEKPRRIDWHLRCTVDWPVDGSIQLGTVATAIRTHEPYLTQLLLGNVLAAGEARCELSECCDWAIEPGIGVITVEFGVRLTGKIWRADE